MEATIRESRRALRFPMNSPVQIRCNDDSGSTRPLPCKGVNISDAGATFLPAEPQPVRAPVQIELPTSEVTVGRRVGVCLWRAGGWRIGAELTEIVQEMEVSLREVEATLSGTYRP
jgi:virulence-associated protein VagC